MRYLCIVFFLFFGVPILAQRPSNTYNAKTFEIVKFKGKIGKFPITMILTFSPNNSSVSGYYYYDNIGRFIRIKSQENGKRYGLITEKFEYSQSNSSESFEFDDSLQIHKSVAKAQWVCENKTLPVVLNRDLTMLDWKLLEIKTVGYFKNSYYNTQTTHLKYIYPDYSSSFVLNRYFLNSQTISNQLRDFINSSKSRYSLIDLNYGENTDDNDEYYWSEDVNTELVFISDSILTYKVNGFAYVNNGSESESFISVKVSSGKQFTINDIFKKDSIDSVFKLLNNKYCNVIKENSDENNNLTYSKDSEIYLSPGGLYFRERLFKLAPYIDLYFSYKELQAYLNDEFKITISFP